MSTRVASAKMMIPQPYLAVRDPGGGRKEEPAAGNEKGGREEVPETGRKRVPAIARWPVSSPSRWAPPLWPVPVTRHAGYPKGSALTWRPSSSRGVHYYRQLRQTAFANYDQGWRTKANEALGGSDQITADGLHVDRFCPRGSDDGRNAPGLSGLLERHESRVERSWTRYSKLVYGGTREEFLDGTGEWVAMHYRGLQ